MELPTTKRPPLNKGPKNLILYGLPKTGKTSIVAALDDCFILELDPYGADEVPFCGLQAKNIEEIKEIAGALIAKKEELGKNPYKYIVVDTATALEEMILPLANEKFRETPMGQGMVRKKTWDATKDVRTLSDGQGYLYIRKAYAEVLAVFNDLCDHFILLGHVKDKSLTSPATGENFMVQTLDLAGKLAQITAANADGIGYIYRKKNQNIISFKPSDDIICGNRCSYLEGEEIVISEKKEDGTVEVYWDRIFKS